MKIRTKEGRLRDVHPKEALALIAAGEAKLVGDEPEYGTPHNKAQDPPTNRHDPRPRGRKGKRKRR